ncbi:Protein of unknown function, partial [Gryllus bimaculatus]
TAGTPGSKSPASSAGGGGGASLLASDSKGGGAAGGGGAQGKTLAPKGDHPSGSPAGGGSGAAPAAAARLRVAPGARRPALRAAGAAARRHRRGGAVLPQPPSAPDTPAPDEPAAGAAAGPAAGDAPPPARPRRHRPATPRDGPAHAGTEPWQGLHERFRAGADAPAALTEAAERRRCVGCEPPRDEAPAAVEEASLEREPMDAASLERRRPRDVMAVCDVVLLRERSRSRPRPRMCRDHGGGISATAVVTYATTRGSNHVTKLLPCASVPWYVTSQKSCSRHPSLGS